MRFLLPRLLSLVGLLLLVLGVAQAQSVPGALQPGNGPALPETPVAATCAHPFGLREGQNLEYQLLDAKGKATGTWRYRVLALGTDTLGKKKKKAVVTTVRLKSGRYDLSNHLLQQQDLAFFCRHDTTFTDGLDDINYEGLKSFRDRRLAYQGTPLAWPNQPTNGTALAGGGAVVQVSSPSVAIAKVMTTVRQRTVLTGPTSVTVPAGTFACYAVESQRELSTAARADLVLKSGGREVDYYDPAVGLVKTEYYDKGGKLMQSRVLARR